MTPDQIKEIKAAHPEQWAAKKRAGLSDAITAQAIAKQLAHDAANPPILAAQHAAKDAIGHAQTCGTLFVQALKNAEAASKAALEIDPEVELPEINLDIPGLSGGDGIEISRLRTLSETQAAQIERDSQRIADLQTELTAEKQRADKAEALLAQVGSCGSIKEVRDLLKPAAATE